MQTMCVLKNKTETYQAAGDQLWSKQEIEECVRFVRLELYNRDMRCGNVLKSSTMSSRCPLSEPLPVYWHAPWPHPWQNRHLPKIKAHRSLPGVAQSCGQARILYDVVTQKQ
jgi:hypothetical protein